MILALAGGVGGAKMADGLAAALPPGDLTVIVNTADDMDYLGLHISPDVDTVLYTLGGLANPVTGWGIAGDTTATLEQLRTYGHDMWFWLGDRDIATHLSRTSRLASGTTLTDITRDMARALGIASTILPMSDDPVRTIVATPDGELAFQEYFVHRRQEPEVTGVSFQGIEAARMTERVREAIPTADLIMLCPSNPIVSIGPILAIPGLRETLLAAAAPIVAISPIIGGKALKGPADRMLTSLGQESSAVGVARLYRGLIDAFVIDEQDAGLAAGIEAETGIGTIALQTIMGDRDDRRRLAIEVLALRDRISRDPERR